MGLKPPESLRSNNAKAAFGSVIAFPLPSLTHPSGISNSRSPLTLTLLTAATVVAKSRTRGGYFPAGAARAKGLVPSTGSVPLVGTIVMPRVDVVTIPIIPDRAANSA